MIWFTSRSFKSDILFPWYDFLWYISTSLKDSFLNILSLSMFCVSPISFLSLSRKHSNVVHNWPPLSSPDQVLGIDTTERPNTTNTTHITTTAAVISRHRWSPLTSTPLLLLTPMMTTTTMTSIATYRPQQTRPVSRESTTAGIGGEDVAIGCLSWVGLVVNHLNTSFVSFFRSF